MIYKSRKSAYDEEAFTDAEQALEVPPMAKLTYFVQECPTCGRGLEVRVEYLGKRVACQHCGGRFTAKDPAMMGDATPESQDALLARVDRLLTEHEHDKSEFAPAPR